MCFMMPCTLLNCAIFDQCNSDFDHNLDKNSKRSVHRTRSESVSNSDWDVKRTVKKKDFGMAKTVEKHIEANRSKD